MKTRTPKNYRIKLKNLTREKETLKSGKVSYLHAQKTPSKHYPSKGLSAARAKIWKLEYELKEECRARNPQEELIISLKATTGRPESTYRSETENVYPNHTQVPPPPPPQFRPLTTSPRCPSTCCLAKQPIPRNAAEKLPGGSDAIKVDDGAQRHDGLQQTDG